MSRSRKWFCSGSASGGSRDFLCLLVLLGVTLPAPAGGAETRKTIATFAGTGVAGYSRDNKPAVSAELANPYGIVCGSDGSLYICEVDNHVIRRVARDGTVTTQAGTQANAGILATGDPRCAPG